MMELGNTLSSVFLKAQQLGNLGFGQESLLKILRLLEIVYPSFSLNGPEDTSTDIKIFYLDRQ